MKNIKNMDALIGYYAENRRVRRAITAELVDKCIVSRTDINKVFRSNVGAENCNPAVLAAVYKVIKSVVGDEAPDVGEFFTDAELQDSLTLTQREAYESFPITFYNVDKISIQDEYVFTLTYQQISELSANKVLQIRTDMQRESEVIRMREDTISCVKCDDRKIKEISDNILSGIQHPNLIRFHLIPDSSLPLDKSFVYNAGEHTITIKNGLLATIDGNHRVNAIVDALYSDPKIGTQTKMIICLTVGNPNMAREIIVQEEKRSPIDPDHLLSFKETEGSRIISKLKMDEEFTKCFRFCTTPSQCIAGGGFITESIFSEAVIKYFKITHALRPSALNKLVSYISSFLMEFYYIVNEKYPNYYKEYNRHILYTMSNPYTICGLIYLASQLKDNPDWENELESIVNMIDFERVDNRHYTDGKTQQVVNYIIRVTGINHTSEVSKSD